MCLIAGTAFQQRSDTADNVVRHARHRLLELVDTQSGCAKLSAKAFPFTTSVIGSPTSSVTSRLAVACSILIFQVPLLPLQSKRRLCHAAGMRGCGDSRLDGPRAEIAPQSRTRPYATQGLNVHAAVNSRMVVFKVNGRRPAKIVQCGFCLSQPRSDDPVHRKAE